MGGIDGSFFFYLTTLVFIILKVCGVINWTWFWVLSPLVFMFGLVLILLIIIAFVINGLSKRQKKEFFKQYKKKF